MHRGPQNIAVRIQPCEACDAESLTETRKASLTWLIPMLHRHHWLIESNDGSALQRNMPFVPRDQAIGRKQGRRDDLIEQRSVVCSLAGVHMHPPLLGTGPVLCPDMVIPVHHVSGLQPALHTYHLTAFARCSSDASTIKCS